MSVTQFPHKHQRALHFAINHDTLLISLLPICQKHATWGRTVNELAIPWQNSSLGETSLGPDSLLIVVIAAKILYTKRNSRGPDSGNGRV